jgi:virulence-associated protein VagC
MERGGEQLMIAVKSKTYKRGDDVVVRLPKRVAFPADLEVTLERVGDAVVIRPAVQPSADPSGTTSLS